MSYRYLVKFNPKNILEESDPNILILDPSFSTVVRFEFFLVHPNENCYQAWDSLLALANFMIATATMVKASYKVQKVMSYGRKI